MTGVTWVSASNRRQRGIAMIMALVFVAVMLFVALAVFAHTTNAAATLSGMGLKTGAFNAAEAGFNKAIGTLNNAPNATACAGAATAGVTFTCGIVNNFPNASATSAPDQASAGNTVTVPAHGAFVYGVAYAGGRRSVVEGVVVPVPDIPFPKDAIGAGGNFNDGGHQPINRSTDGAPADVYANGNIFAGGNPSTVQGQTFAVGVDQLAGEGNPPTHSGAAPMQLPSDSIVQTSAAFYRNRAQGGRTVSGSDLSNFGGAYDGNVFVDGDVNLGGSQTVTFTGTGVIFINGNVEIGGQATLVNDGGSTIVVNGSFSITSRGTGFTVASGLLMKPILLVLQRTDSATTAPALDINGQGDEAIGLVYAPYGSIVMRGNGRISGAIFTGTRPAVAGLNTDISFSGGGNRGALQYDSGTAGTTLKTGLNEIISYAER